jgi:hypothetical protein
VGLHISVNIQSHIHTCSVIYIYIQISIYIYIYIYIYFIYIYIYIYIYIFIHDYIYIQYAIFIMTYLNVYTYMSRYRQALQRKLLERKQGQEQGLGRGSQSGPAPSTPFGQPKIRGKNLLLTFAPYIICRTCIYSRLKLD